MARGRPRGVTTRAALILALLIIGPQVAGAGPTYYVSGSTGSDAYSELEARDNPSRPWQTIKKAVDTGGIVNTSNPPGSTRLYTVVVQPGEYNESVESKRDGLADAPVEIRAETAGTVTIQPPPGTNGFFVSHHHHVVEGFTVTGAVTGLKMGPHDGGDGPVVGLVARSNVVQANSNNGIQFTNAVDGKVEFNTVNANGLNGISYSGNGSLIHDNVANNNGQFGIYVRDGVDHRVWSNAASGNGTGNIKILGSLLPPPVGQPPGQRTFYVNRVTGDDAYDELQAQDPATPWKTIRRGLLVALPGETVAILPGVYPKVESVRDGVSDAPITIRAVEPGSVTIDPASGSGVYVGHHYHVVEGLVIRGGLVGLQMGPYKGSGQPVMGLVASGNMVRDNNGAGIKFTNAVDGTAVHNVVRSNGREGISYAGSGATIFNNLVHGNGWRLAGEYAISIATGDRHLIMNNTVYGNQNGGMRLGTSNSVPVFSTVLNNIVVQNPTGIREPAGSDYVGRAILDYNNVFGNSAGDYTLSKGSGSVPGPNSISVSPGFVDPGAGDFRLSRTAAGPGQTVDSLVIDRGSDTAEAVGLAGRTAFTDKYPDLGPVDLGYHGTILRPVQGTLRPAQGAAAVTGTLTLAPNGDGFTLSANLLGGAPSDGIELGQEYVEIRFGALEVFVPAGSFVPQSGNQWVSNGSAVQTVLKQLTDGSVDVTVTAGALDSSGVVEFVPSVTLRVGDDFGSVAPRLRGTLEFP